MKGYLAFAPSQKTLRPAIIDPAWLKRVLNGEAADSIPFELIEESALYFNSKALEAMGLTLPEELANAGTDVAQ